jgi:hypothetical protein
VDFFTELLEETTQSGQIALRLLWDLNGCYCLNLARATTIRRHYYFIILLHERRQVVHFNVTEHPISAWTAQQMSASLE